MATQDEPGCADRPTFAAIIVSVMLTIGLVSCIYMFSLTRSELSGLYDVTALPHPAQGQKSGTGTDLKP
jgi:hypothetical protein